MCGIAGIFYFKDKDKRIEPSILYKMTETLSHRGPDEEGFYINKNIGLGHRRLSIIDLEKGRQPIFNEDKNICVICNGEIYNFIYLRKELKNKGHIFYTNSDTETIVHLYEEEGIDFILKLDGMFSICLWDEKIRTLFLIRDYFGKKPLYYFIDKEKILFASEIKALLQFPNLSKEINFSSLSYYFSFLSIPYPYTIFENIYKLSPGSYIKCNQDEIKIFNYWKPPIFLDSNKFKIKDLKEEIKSLFFSAVKKRLIADVPLGVFLSGGIDSSAVVAVASKLLNEPVNTFTAEFKGFSYYDESTYANKISKLFNTNHHSLNIEFKLIEDLSKIIWFCDEPFAVSSALALFYLSKVAKNFVKVVLTGDGADEVFAGYFSRYWWEYLSEFFIRKLPFQNFYARLINKSLDFFPLNLRNKIFKISYIFNKKDPIEKYLYTMIFLTPQMLKRLFKKELWNHIDENFNYLKQFYYEYQSNDNLNRIFYGDIRTNLVNEMLSKVDKMTMANGLEARCPFLDKELVEFTMKLPSKYKINFKGSKYILKQVFLEILPKEILERKKHGFELPINEWLRKGLKNYMLEILSREELKKHNYFNSDYIDFLIKTHLSRKLNLGHHLWAILNFQIWFNIFMQ